MKLLLSIVGILATSSFIPGHSPTFFCLAKSIDGEDRNKRDRRLRGRRTATSQNSAPSEVSISSLDENTIEHDSVDDVETNDSDPHRSERSLLASSSGDRSLQGTALPTGSWSINGNSYKDKLVIRSVDSLGNLAGTVYGNGIVGFWDGVSHKISFIRVPPDPAASSQYQIFTGYLFWNSSKGKLVYTLAGTFEVFAGTGGVAQRSLYGWYATITK